MSLNNANVLRPPILVVNNSDSEAPTYSGANLSTTNANILSPELQSAISTMIQNAINNQRKDSLSANSAAVNTEASEEVIEERFCSYSGEIDKIPDVVRCLREFDGDPSAFSSWKKSVDRILKMYEPTRGTPKYYSILNVVRNKIVGNADVVLESYNTPLNWVAISRCLTMHYADRRDIRTLEFQLMSLVQGKKTIEQFYQVVYQNLSLILNKIACQEIDNTSMSLLTKTYRDKALDAFIRGLNGDLPRLLAIREPTDLPQALHLCMKLENQNFRSIQANYANSHYTQYQVMQYPARQQQQHPARQQQQFQAGQQQQFYPQLAYLPQQPHSSRNAPQYAPPRPPKPIDRGEPKDVDHSVQTHRVNYMNRPNNNQQFKRPASNQRSMNKRQRNFNINTSSQTLLPLPSEPDVANHPEFEYENLPSQDITDVHFLE